MDSLRDDHLIDPPAGREPCECDVASAKKELSDQIDDLMDAHGLEFMEGLSIKWQTKLIDGLIDSLIGPVGTCSDCKPVKGEE